MSTLAAAYGIADSAPVDPMPLCDMLWSIGVYGFIFWLPTIVKRAATRWFQAWS